MDARVTSLVNDYGMGDVTLHLEVLITREDLTRLPNELLFEYSAFLRGGSLSEKLAALHEMAAFLESSQRPVVVRKNLPTKGRLLDLG